MLETCTVSGFCCPISKYEEFKKSFIVVKTK